MNTLTAAVITISDSTFAGAGFSSAAVILGNISIPYTLPAGDGAKTLYVQVRDRAGLVSTAVNGTVTLDTHRAALQIGSNISATDA